MFLKRFCIKKSFIRQGLFLVFLSSVTFTACSVSFATPNTSELKECKSEEDRKVGCIVKRYYENGNLESETPYKNGVFEGIVKLYYENGNIASEIPFMNDEVHGSVKFYSKKLILQANAQNGKLINGKCANGKILTNAHLARINKAINEGYANEDSWLEICED